MLYLTMVELLSCSGPADFLFPLNILCCFLLLVFVSCCDIVTRSCTDGGENNASLCYLLLFTCVSMHIWILCAIFCVGKNVNKNKGFLMYIRKCLHVICAPNWDEEIINTCKNYDPTSIIIHMITSCGTAAFGDIMRQ